MNFIIIGILLAIGGLLSILKGIRSKIKPLVLISLISIDSSLLFFTLGVLYLTLNLNFYRIISIVTIPISILYIMLISFTEKETLKSFYLVPIIIFSILIFFIAIDPFAIVVTYVKGYPQLQLTPIKILTELNFLFFGMFGFYWAFRIWKNAPFEIKREANILLFGAILVNVVNIVFNLLSNIIYELFFISLLSLAIGELIQIFLLINEPKIFYILPFIPFRIVVKSMDGKTIFQHQWARVNKDVEIFIASVKNEISKEIGEFTDLEMKNGVLLVFKNKLTEIEFFTSKSSKFLKDLIRQFSLEFEQIFQEMLKKSETKKEEYETVYDIIAKYFSIFPSRLIKNNQQELLFSADFVKIPQDMDDKLKKIFNEEEYKKIKCDIQRTQEGIDTKFLDLYKELKDEFDQDE